MAESAMEESSNLMSRSRDLLATPSHEGLATVINNHFTSQETDEHQTAAARSLFKFCADRFSNCLTLMLLKVYRNSQNDVVVRFRSICLLSKTLDDLSKTRGFGLSLIALNDIKPLLITCLTIPKATKSDTKILGRIVSLVAFNVMKLDNGDGWDELGDCINSLAGIDPLRAFSVFLDLPQFHGEFAERFVDRLLDEAYKVLSDHELDREDDWSLALETAMKLAIQLLDSHTRFFVAGEIVDSVVELADEIVRRGKEQFLERGLARLAKFLEQDSKMCVYSSEQRSFVSEFAYKIGAYNEDSAEKISQVVIQLEAHVSDPDFELKLSFVEDQGDDLQLYNELKNLSAVELLRNVLESNMNDRSMEMAIRMLHCLLCDHTSGETEISDSEMVQLQELLIGCLEEVEMPENTFKILAQVVFHVAHEMFSSQEDEWLHLWEYLSTSCKTLFKEAVYIFQCLTMPLDDNRYVIYVIDDLLPEISSRLSPPPRVLLVDNSYWVMVFVGAFCAAIHLVKITSHAEKLEKIVNQMIESVRVLVERGMEIGLVRRAFRDLETVVKKQVEWYERSEYSFVKALLEKLCAINGMKMESRMVLWRINAMLEKDTHNVPKGVTKEESQTAASA
ncbi:unnamed protein product [Cochlearia groenlandica]